MGAMMPTVQEDREIRAINRDLQRQGIEGNFELKLNEKRQWYKSDGTPAGLYPTDDYNSTVFKGNGWTLNPPREVVPQVKGPSPIELEIQRAKEKAALKAAGQLASPIGQEVQRETASQLQGQAVAAQTFNFLEGVDIETLPEPSVGTPVEDNPKTGITLSCKEPDCDYVATGKTKNMRASALTRHTYGPRSKHKKEKN